jgi:hypothetical protein
MWALQPTSGWVWRRRDLRATVSGCRCGCCGARRHTSLCGQTDRVEHGSDLRGNWPGDRWPRDCVRGRRTPWSLMTVTSRWGVWMPRLRRSWRRFERTGASLLMGGGITRWRWRGWVIAAARCPHGYGCRPTWSHYVFRCKEPGLVKLRGGVREVLGEVVDVTGLDDARHGQMRMMLQAM